MNRIRQRIPYFAVIIGIPASYFFRFHSNEELALFFQKVSNVLQIIAGALSAYLVYAALKKRMHNPKTSRRFNNASYAIMIILVIAILFVPLSEKLQWFLETILAFLMGIWFSVIDQTEGTQTKKHKHKKK